jgi:hypothetical protein
MYQTYYNLKNIENSLNQYQGFYQYNREKDEYRALRQLRLNDKMSKNELYEESQKDYENKMNSKNRLNDLNINGLDFDIYNKIANRKQFKKADLDKFGISESLMKKYANKETPKQFSEVDTIGLVNELIKGIENKPLYIGGQLKAEKEYLGYCSTIYPEVDDTLYMVCSFETYKDPTHPYCIMRNLSTGEETKVDVKSKFYRARPFGEWSILRFDHFDYEFKKKKNSAGQWESTNEQKPVLESYEVVKR